MQINKRLGNVLELCLSTSERTLLYDALWRYSALVKERKEFALILALCATLDPTVSDDGTPRSLYIRGTDLPLLCNAMRLYASRGEIQTVSPAFLTLHNMITVLDIVREDEE